MNARRLAGREVFPIGMGCAGLSVADFPPEADAVRAIHAGLDAGVQVLDTAACYVPDEHRQGHNEAIIAKALATWSGDASDVVVATKTGIKRTGAVDFNTDFLTSGRPEFVRETVETSLRCLGVDSIFLLQLHTPGPDVPITETMGAFAALQAEGKVQHCGLSNVTVDELEAARTVVDIVSVQNRFNPADRRSADVIRHCNDKGIAFLAYSPLDGLGAGARTMPGKVPAIVDVAAERGVSPHQVALAWELAVSPNVIPIPGARRPETIRDSAGAATVELTPDELARIGGL